MQYQSRNSGFISISNSKLLLGIGTLIIVFMAINLFKAVDENRKIQDRIDRLHNNLAVVSAENKMLTETFDYVQTDLFIETEARNKLNMKKEGETVVSLPPEKVTVNDEIEAEYQSLAERDQKPNPVKWLDYFFAAPADASES